jgi:uncharacterized membrane protein (DUF4010 family)
LVKKVLFTLLQFVLFSLVYVAGVVMATLHMSPSHVATWADGTKFEWDGVFLTLALFAVILLIEALRKRLRGAAPLTTLALVLAALAEFVVKFGLITPDR